MKKGFTLIETIIAVSLSFLILLWGIKALGIYTRILYK
ncbi:prepilin-type N-terminal cleavage/methylation domain-containing protein [Clostridium cochlearium]|nr:prepilin-type N-terminal cleavage/methylation domain-containing protein [Clostridium cochlearium]NMA57637.1 prepilin-type N-terminal cleavage/methylation domain-containing protein [Clostridium cochlearium]